MDEKQWLHEYLERYQRSIFQSDVSGQLIRLKNLLDATHASGKKVILAGNGGSASMASHCAVDLTKNARIVTFGWVALWIVGEIAYRSLDAGGHEFGAPGWSFMLSLRELSIVATAGVLDLQGQVDFLVEQFMNRQLDVKMFEDFVEDVTHPGMVGGFTHSAFSFGLLVALSVGCGLVVMRRVTKPVRI